MTDQAAAKRVLNELIKREDLGNKTCVDCGNPNPQWASISFAIFICLQCAGQHRGYGVHISFVRSVSMDTWSDEQIKRMQMGGNKPFKVFVRSYQPADIGAYSEGMAPYDQYHCWAATQYRSKLDADVAGNSWTPSAPPPELASAPDRPSSAQGLRKSRASGRSAPGTPLRSDTGSPASFGGASGPMDQKSQNEVYFERLGSANAFRSEDLPPNQGGKYTGFGSSPTPAANPSGSSFGLSSASAPTLTDLQENPMAALGKGWSLFSSVVGVAARTVNDNVIQPGMERVMDPEFQANVKGYATAAGQRATQVGGLANDWSKHTLGVDVAGQVGGAISSFGGGASSHDRSGYGSIPQGYDAPGHGYNDDDDDEAFFDNFSGQPASSSAAGRSNAAAPATTAAVPAKKADDWDDWKDF